MATACLEEDSVKYLLFPTVRSKNKTSTGLQTLELFAERYVLMLSSFISKFIWHNESFYLHPVAESTGIPSHLEGVTNFGDNVEDEWFIVYLLFHLTKEDPGLVVKVEDNDGDFLLIEAAEFLPKWVNPDTTVNRVFIYQGALHIIPVACCPGEITPIPCGTPTLSDAVSAIRQYSTITKASDFIQQAINTRIDGYPEKVKQDLHKAHCYVPASIAVLLKEEPQLMSAAGKAFYLRDPLDMKACRAMKYFPPETRVMTEVIFTRCLYAQLISQMYEPDSRTGWNMPAQNDPSYKAHSLGMKLACGFEVLASNASKHKDMEDEEAMDIDFNNDVRWKRFAYSLNGKGYFQGELEGSKLYNQLMSQAKNFYLSSFNRKKYVDQGTHMLNLLKTLNVNYEELKEAEKSLLNPDDDSWMDISIEQLDATLESIANRNSMENVSTAIATTLKKFLSHNSDFEGAELPGGNKKKRQRVNLESETFAESINNILDFRIPNSDDYDEDSSSMSSYSSDENEDVDYKANDTSKSVNGEAGTISEAKDTISEFQRYMEQMDHELSRTNIGLSFEKSQPQPAGTSRERKGGKGDGSAEDIDNEEDDFTPVDIDLNAVKNILESYSSQHGLPGPASNLFSSLGVTLPLDSDT